MDVMGIQSSMSRSLPITANFIFKLHASALLAPNAGVTLYPVMDGLYAATPNQATIFEFLRAVFVEVANEFNQAADPLHRFIIRAALAYGPVIHGTAVPANASNPFQSAAGTAYKNAILLGIPMVQAHQAERNAPPFGLFVHESARAFSPVGTNPLHHVWWKWVNPNNAQIWNTLRGNLQTYYQWVKQRPNLLLYDADRIIVHEGLVEQYFA
ncbi:MAG: hypothetical protein EPO27_20065 [Betaproteobacteria bacterium]|nr:MAG: hypothetical protein EPO27_20065 [Betaproteobacteria bacterium]